MIAIRLRLFHNAFFEVLGEVCTHHAGNMLGSNLLHVMRNHYLNKLFERSCLRIPAKFVLRLCRVAPEVDNVCRTVEVLTDSDNDLACLHIDTLLVDAFAFPTQLYAA